MWSKAPMSCLIPGSVYIPGMRSGLRGCIFLHSGNILLDHWPSLFYVDYGADGKITTRYGTISLKTGETELLDLETGQLRDIDPETLAGNPSVNLYLCLSLDANRALPGDRLHPKIIQSKTRFVYGGLTATFINTILIHNGRLVQDCENGRNHFYLSSEKSLLCHLKDQVFYDFDRRVVCTLASTEVLVPVKARAEGIGWQGRMPLRNGSFF